MYSLVNNKPSIMVVEESERANAPKEHGHVAIIFGVTGLVGKELLRKLLSTSNWKVYGVARRPDVTPIQNPNYHFISCDLLQSSETEEKLSRLQDATHVFWVTWASQFPLDSRECCDQNREMMSNALNAILPNAKGLKHFSLQTGTKHYISLQGPFGGLKEVYYYDEGSPRAISGSNFYYVLEDLLKEKLRAGKIAWSVHRPGLIMGSSQRTLFNFMGSLCVYGSICMHLNLPFIFGGAKECWEEMFIDGSDARLVADQHIWSASSFTATACSYHGQAFNSINGESFIWKDIWGAIGKKFGAVGPVPPNNAFSEDFRYSTAMADKGDIWKEVVAKEGLVKTEMGDLANWEFLDVLFRCPVKMLGTREKVDRLGFTMRYHTLDSIMYWIEVMRNDKLIPGNGLL